MAADLKGQPGEVRMTLHIKRKATGQVETRELVGRVISVEQRESKEKEDGANPQRSGS